jgi:ankyrin repeat protein
LTFYIISPNIFSYEKINSGVGMMKNSIFLYFFLTFFIFTGCSNNNAEFSKAITDGDLTKVKSLLEDGAEVNTKFSSLEGKKQTPLHIAVNNGRKRIARLLIGHGADLFAVDAAGLTPIQTAELKKDQEMIDILMQIGYVKQRIIRENYFSRVLRDRFNSYRRLYGNMDSEKLNQLLVKLKIHDMVLHSLINSLVIQYEAEKLNIGVSDEELREKIVNYPSFQVNGKFIGIEKYKMLLARHRISPDEFENDLRIEMITKKLLEKITGEISIDEEVLKKEYADSKKESSKTLEEFINNKIEEKKNEAFGKFLTNKKQEYEIKVNRPLFESISKRILGKI